MEIAGLDEEFEKYFSAGKTPENIDIEELIRTLTKINEIPEEGLDKLKVAVLEEYETYWQGKRK